MRVFELAEQLGLTNDIILAKLKTLMLKAKDGKQELSDAVVAVLRRELSSVARPPAAKSAKPPAPEQKTVKEKSKEKPVAKMGVKEKKAPAAKVADKKIPAKKLKTGKARPLPQKAKTTKIEKAQKAIVKEKPAPAAKLPKAFKEEKLSVKLVEKVVSAPAPAVTVVVQTKPSIVAKQPVPRVTVPVASPAEIKKDVKVVESKKTAATPAVSAPQQPVAASTAKDLQDIELQLPISVKDLSVRLQQKPSIIIKKLMQRGVLVHINQSLDENTVNSLAAEFGFRVLKMKTQEEQMIEVHGIPENTKFLKHRSPVVTFMGHVDHGKTSLLDCIRKSKVADQEHGGITQHIGAYSVTFAKGKITFLDTPGHEAFTAMRARGAHITDLVVLVVAVDEGVMPQTEEAIDHARAANVPIIVALNKIDKKNADIDRVKKQLAEHDLMAEDWGGKTITVGVSAHTGEGVDHLLEMVLLEAEMLDLKANPDKKASGIIVEARLSPGRGSVVTVIVQNGTLKDSDIIVAGPFYGKIKAMLDDRKRLLSEAPPAAAAEILGLSGVPDAGEIFYVVDDERTAKEIVAKRQEQIKNQKFQSQTRITLEDLYSQIQQGKIRELNIILKADVHGSLEALKDSLSKIVSEEVKLKFIHSGVGEINASDIILAGASAAIIIGFNVDVGVRAKEELEKRPVDIRTYRIIYDVIKDVKNALSGLLEPKTKKIFLGRVEIRQVFKLSKSGIVAGCFVLKGKVNRKANIEIVRNGDVVFSGGIASLKRFKDDVREVTEGFECGITINGFGDIQPNDIIEVFELEKIARTL